MEITEYLLQYLEQCVTGPNLPATVLMILILIYGATVIIGALDIDLFNVDLDLDADAGVDAFSSAGFVVLRYLNIGEVPLMLWISVFGLSWWTLSLMLWFLWDEKAFEPSTWLTAQLVVRNVALGVVLTKVLTQPLVKVFERQEQFKPEDMIGRECVISSYEATTQYGQAKYTTEAAPLLLNVKTEEGKLIKGDRAVVVDYDPNARIYFVSAVASEEMKAEEAL